MSSTPIGICYLSAHEPARVNGASDKQTDLTGERYVAIGVGACPNNARPGSLLISVA
jgi:hypothetical protein